MAGVSRSDLRTRCKQRASMENATFITDAEWNTYIDEAGAELHDLILMSDPTAIRATYSFSTVAGTETYALPASFYRMAALYWVSGGNRYNLERFDLHELGTPQGYVDLQLYGIAPFRYAIQGSNIILSPNPTTAYNLEMWYYPMYTYMTDDADTLNYPVINGWEQFVVITAVIKAKMKEESKVNFELAEKAELKNRIVKMAMKRDLYNPPQSRNAYGPTRFRRFRGRRLH